MKKIAIFGAGGFGREVACLIRHINQKELQWDFVGFFDDGKELGSQNEYGKILGGIDSLNHWNTPISIVIAIGNPRIVKQIVSLINNENVDFPNLIAPDILFFDDKNVTFGKGNIISFNCTISCNVHIGDFNCFNNLITVGHDTVIGNYNTFMPDVRISGSVTIGDENFFGVSSVVLQQIKIGNQTVVGANSLILRKTKDGQTYVGSPATIVKY